MVDVSAPTPATRWSIAHHRAAIWVSYRWVVHFEDGSLLASPAFGSREKCAKDLERYLKGCGTIKT